MIFSKIYEEGANASDLPVLIEVGTALGIENVEDYLNSDKDLEEVQQEAREASRQGITGVPFFAAYRKGTQKEPLTFSGAHPPKTLLKAIQSIAAEVAE
mmetsp:Transcript_53708/g.127694  ORF Transcript_53708/g.127694 Transcript_53708/m.127694 type:complete len:99 (-) Transcript_53708:21-317(-)